MEHLGIDKRTSFMKKLGKQGRQEASGVEKKSRDYQEAQGVAKAIPEEGYQGSCWNLEAQSPRDMSTSKTGDQEAGDGNEVR